MPTLDELRAAMAARLSDAGIAVDTGVPTRRDPERARLSFSQRLVWTHQQRVPDSTANNICLTFTYTGDVDVDALQQALLAVVQRHEILRTTYHPGADGEEPHQRIHADFPPPILSVDLSDAAEPHERLRLLVADAATEVFDLATESSIRLTFVTLPQSDGQSRLAVVVAMQHIVWDGMTLPAMARDVARFYEAARETPGKALAVEALSPQVADFAEWERDRFDDADHGADVAFWEDQFRGDVATAALPYDRRPEHSSEVSARADRTLSPAAEKNLRVMASTLKTPPFSVFLAAYYLALRRLSGHDDVVVGSTVANREEQGAEALIGNFSNSIALRIRGSDDDTFGGLVRHVRGVTDAAFEHRTFPFDEIVEIARRVTGDENAHPFDSLVLFLDQKIDGIHLPGTTMTWELADKGRVALPLTVEAFMHPDHTEVQIGYQVDLFDASTVQTLHDHLDDVLATISVDAPLAERHPRD
ncbi:condensation domain-containing protein [Gordonia sp. HY002]|uniref:condensation domain-containing protein n=1 Tax=Gordonia zhenghanii TaxID=2911516 RepID=UPI001EF0BB0B|nr:condensation domain-containing protein [Gordonia zhenghanii]MCF8568832.1 condensation domain-containing protein [Gordonia zhenghanii]MCF8602298.1 condensation domain-containing protein [Gordonia zhenghanii]